MPDTPLEILLVANGEPAWARSGLRITQAAAATDAARYDAVVFLAPDPSSLAQLLVRGDLQTAAFDSAVVVVAPGAGLSDELALLSLGVQDVLSQADPEAVVRALRHAVARKRLERSARLAYATDLATGLPHQAQLLEHMSHLLALRERAPAPMVLLVLRVEGLASAGLRLGLEAANILRRKVAVRLRSGLRASDVVASIAADSFGVLLGHLEAVTDGDRVAAKLVQSLQRPFSVAGQACHVAVAVGMARFPDDGKEAPALLQRAVAQAAGVAALGREGFGARTERGPAQAANDEDGPAG